MKNKKQKSFVLKELKKFSKKSQAWGIDLMVGAFIFLIGITVFYIYSMNSPEESKETVESISYDSKFISDTILSEGYPINWNPSNVIRIGVLTKDKIDETKLEVFYNLAQTDYNRTKILFDTKYDYYFFMDKNISSATINVRGIGKPNFDINNINAKNLIKVTRFVIYKDEPLTAYVYIWEE